MEDFQRKQKEEKSKERIGRNEATELHNKYRRSGLNEEDTKLQALRLEGRKKEQDAKASWHSYKKNELKEDEIKLLRLREEARRKEREAIESNNSYKHGADAAEEALRLKAMKEEERRKQLENEERWHRFQNNDVPDELKRRRNSVQKQDLADLPPMAEKLDRQDELARIAEGYVSTKAAALAGASPLTETYNTSPMKLSASYNYAVPDGLPISPPPLAFQDSDPVDIVTDGAVSVKVAALADASPPSNPQFQNEEKPTSLEPTQLFDDKALPDEESAQGSIAVADVPATEEVRMESSVSDVVEPPPSQEMDALTTDEEKAEEAFAQSEEEPPVPTPVKAPAEETAEEPPSGDPPSSAGVEDATTEEKSEESPVQKVGVPPVPTPVGRPIEEIEEDPPTEEPPSSSSATVEDATTVEKSGESPVQTAGVPTEQLEVEAPAKETTDKAQERADCESPEQPVEPSAPSENASSEDKAQKIPADAIGEPSVKAAVETTADIAEDVPSDDDKDELFAQPTETTAENAPEDTSPKEDGDQSPSQTINEVQALATETSADDAAKEPPTEEVGVESPLQTAELATEDVAKESPNKEDGDVHSTTPAEVPAEDIPEEPVSHDKENSSTEDSATHVLEKTAAAAVLTAHLATEDAEPPSMDATGENPETPPVEATGRKKLDEPIEAQEAGQMANATPVPSTAVVAEVPTVGPTQNGTPEAKQNAPLAGQATVVRLDVLFSFGLLTSSTAPTFDNYLFAVEEIVKKSLGDKPDVKDKLVYDPVYGPFVQEWNPDETYTDPSGRTNVRRVVVIAAIPIFLDNGISITESRELICTGLQGAIVSGDFVSLAKTGMWAADARKHRKKTSSKRAE